MLFGLYSGLQSLGVYSGLRGVFRDQGCVQVLFKAEGFIHRLAKVGARVLRDVPGVGGVAGLILAVDRHSELAIVHPVHHPGLLKSQQRQL